MITSERAKEIIDKIEYITIATASKHSQPWNSPVYSVHDENYVFYWGSDINSQHSRNIAENNQIFLVIYDSTVPAGTGEAVYIKAKAQQLTSDEEINMAYKLLTIRRVPVAYWKLDDMLKKSPRLYRATPEKIWVNDEGSENGIYIDTRREINLE